jgi:proliferating cell nuclear antigen
VIFYQKKAGVKENLFIKLSMEDNFSGKTFEATTVQTHIFKTLIEALKEILTEANIELSQGNRDDPDDAKKGTIKIVALDPSKNTMVHLKLEGKEFQTYYCKEKTVIGISMANFNKLIKTITTNDTLTLYQLEKETSKLGIEIKNADQNGVTTYDLNLMDLNQEEVTIPQQVFDNVITMPSSDFQKIIRDMSSLSDTIEIKNVANKLEFSCKGDFAKQKTVRKENLGMQVDDNNYKVIQGYFNLKHLNLFTKCTNLSQSVQIFLKNDFPLIIQYAVGSLGYLKFALAPKKMNNPDII